MELRWKIRSGKLKMAENADENRNEEAKKNY